MGGAATASCALAGGFASDSAEPVVASYSGDGTYASASSELTQQVAAIAPELALSVSPDPAGAGAAVGLTATVGGSLGPGEGTITFSEDGNPLGSCGQGGQERLSGVGSAFCSFTAPATPGNALLTATYDGSSAYAPAGAAAGLDVDATGASPSTTTLAYSPAPAAAGGSITYRATVSGSGAVPTGSVTFNLDGVPLAGCGTAGVVALAGGAATCTVLGPSSPGVHQLDAGYSGDQSYSPSATLQPEEVATAPRTRRAGARRARPDRPPAEQRARRATRRQGPARRAARPSARPRRGARPLLRWRPAAPPDPQRLRRRSPRSRRGRATPSGGFAPGSPSPSPPRGPSAGGSPTGSPSGARAAGPPAPSPSRSARSPSPGAPGSGSGPRARSPAPSRAATPRPRAG